MVAATVLVVVFLAGFTAMRTGFEMLDTARNSTLASQIMQSEMEDLRLKNWAELSDTTKYPATASITLPADIASTGLSFTATRSISDLSAYNNTMKKVVIVVKWTSFTGKNYTRTYETLYSKNGVNDYFVSTHS